MGLYMERRKSKPDVVRIYKKDPKAALSQSTPPSSSQGRSPRSPSGDRYKSHNGSRRDNRHVSRNGHHDNPLASPVDGFPNQPLNNYPASPFIIPQGSQYGGSQFGNNQYGGDYEYAYASDGQNGYENQHEVLHRPHYEALSGSQPPSQFPGQFPDQSTDQHGGRYADKYADQYANQHMEPIGPDIPFAPPTVPVQPLIPEEPVTYPAQRGIYNIEEVTTPDGQSIRVSVGRMYTPDDVSYQTPQASRNGPQQDKPTNRFLVCNPSQIGELNQYYRGCEY
ncbi:hypothetical protein F5Y11DRAFT_346383 [Daldinia sp. FL1419]|nr:hypothetical protein F5Y11DRAFT_346383 [Daldinia sp. FL1419]